MTRYDFEELPRGRVLVIAPHADDEVLGCGGTLSRHIERGDEVEVLILTDGARGTADGRADHELVQKRRDEAVAGMALLGVTKCDFWDLPEGHEPDAGLLGALSLRLAMSVSCARPDVVYAPWIGEGHADHFHAARLARLGLALAAFDGLALGYEVWTPLEPRWLVDVSAVWGRKRAAVSEHSSQLEHTDLYGIARANAARRAHLLTGKSEGGLTPRAEAFCLLGAPEAADRELLSALAGEAA
ncbi:MAG: PIG-L family deacetylase [Planctomycetes bacterium]|nr:PIG-L family deacetylase [Planctomycetota bacterium]